MMSWIGNANRLLVRTKARKKKHNLNTDKKFTKRIFECSIDYRMNKKVRNVLTSQKRSEFHENSVPDFFHYFSIFTSFFFYSTI